MTTRKIDMEKSISEAAEELADENDQLKEKLKEAIYFRFKIHEDVTIKQLGVPGRVFGRADRGNAHDYRVVWWSDGKRQDEWLYEHELAPQGNGV